MENDTSSTSLSNETVESPSLALLERLQQLRKWQEKQREALMRTHSTNSTDVSTDFFEHSKATGTSTPASLKNKNDSQFSRSLTSVLSYQHENFQRGNQITPQKSNLSGKEQVAQGPCDSPAGFSECYKDIPETQLSESGISYSHDNTQKGEQHLLKTYEVNINHEPSFVGGRHDCTPNDVSDMRMELSFYDSGNRDNHHSKSISTHNKIYTGGAPLVRPVVKFVPSLEDQAIRTQDTNFDDLQENLAKEVHVEVPDDTFKAKKPFLRKKSGLSRYEGKNKTVTEVINPVPSAMYWEPEISPTAPAQLRPKQKFLRKGEGTARFRMAPLRLKKKKAIEVSLDERNIEPQKHQEELKEKIINCTMAATGPQQSISPERQLLHTYPSRIANRPIRTLQLKEGPGIAVEPEFPENEQKYKSKERENENKLHTKSFSGNKYKLPGAVKTPVLKEKEDDKRRRKEQEELCAFEKLEELAADSSFSSNSSTVWNLLQKGQRSTSSTPLRSPPPFTPQETPITRVGNQSPQSNIVSRNLLQRLVQVGVLPEESFLSIEEKDQMESQQSGSQQQKKIEQVLRNPSGQPQQQLLSVSAVLEQLKAIVRLEKTDDLEVSQEELQTLVESFTNPNVPSPLESGSLFLHGVRLPTTNWTSTPAHPPEISPASGPRVHFRSEGVEVLEYEPSDTEQEDTLTDAPSIAEDDTDLVTTSDLEALALLNMHKFTKDKVESTRGALSDPAQQSTDDDSSSTVTGIRHGACAQNKASHHLLEFSPPPQRLHHSASNYIWSIFGKERDVKKDQKNTLPCQSRKDMNLNQQKQKDVQSVGNKQTREENLQKTEARHINEEIEAHKALLLAKICELEKETEYFKKETTKLKNLQQFIQNEKKQMDQEKQILIENLEKEKINFQKYVDRERNNLWKEKQELKRTAPSLTMVQDKSLEVVYLKEQIEDLQKELQRKESLNQFALKKMNDKIKVLEQENRQLKEKNASLQILEKENLDLKHKLDRTKLSKKTALKDTQNNTTRGQKIKKKAVTIDSINKSLSKKLTDAPIKPVTSHKEIPSTMELYIQDPLVQKSDNVPQNPATKSAIHHAQILAKSTNENAGSVDSVQEASTWRENISVISEKGQIIPPVVNADAGSDKVSEYTEFHKSDGSTEVIYANGNKKIIYPNGSVIVSYYNGDRKEVHGDRTVYIYGTDQTSHITYNDGKEVLEFPNGQKEIRFPDGSSEIVFADSSRKSVSSDGTEICTMKDGTVVRTDPNGTKVFEFASGQREIHTNREKRREYPDGTVKILHPDGRTETRYKTGRVRIKDQEGNIISDTHQGVQ